MFGWRGGGGFGLIHFEVCPSASRPIGRCSNKIGPYFAFQLPMIINIMSLIEHIDGIIPSPTIDPLYNYEAVVSHVISWLSDVLFGYSRTPVQRPSLSYDHISCDGQCFLFVYESLTSDHPSYKYDHTNVILRVVV